MKTLNVHATTFFKRSVSVAEHYGFRNIDELHSEAQRKGVTVLELKKEKQETFEKHVFAEVLLKCNQMVALKKKQPLMFYTPSIVSHPAHPDVRISTFTLNAVGANDPLMEAILVKSTLNILKDVGIKNCKIRVNSIGDRDSSARFIREITQRIKKNINDFTAEEQTCMRKNPGDFITTLFTQRHPITGALPSPLEFLTTPSRRHFKEVLELFESVKIPYVLDDHLYADPKAYSHTIYEIVEDDDTDSDTILARGGRYDELTRKYVRTAIPSSGIAIAMHTKEDTTANVRMRRKKPTACLIHIGRDARITTIDIMEVFRHKKIPIEQCLHLERFSDQMAYAQAQNVQYVIIIGQKEAQEGVALLRNTVNRTQTIEKISMLPDILLSLQR